MPINHWAVARDIWRAMEEGKDAEMRPEIQEASGEES